MSRATTIADAADHVTRAKICTPAEWRGYLWYLHDRDARTRPTGAGVEHGIEAAKLLLERDKAVRS